MSYEQRWADAAWRAAFPDRPVDEDSLEVTKQVAAKMRRMRLPCTGVTLSDQAFYPELGFTYSEIWTGMYRVFVRFDRR